MISENKYFKLISQIFSLLCFIAIVVCLICDYAINKTMVWSGYPITSIFFAWMVILPLLLAKRNKILFSLIAMTIATIPFLYLLECLTPVKGWFLSLGTPITLISMMAIWIMFFVVKIHKVNRWYISAIAVFLFGVVVSTAVRYFVSKFLDTNFYSLDNSINLLSSIALTFLLAFVGNNRQQNGRLKKITGKLQ